MALRMNRWFPAGFSVNALRTLRTAACSCLVVLLAADLSGAADQNGETAVLQKLLAGIREKVDSTRTVQADFTQQRNLALFTHPIVFTGRMALRRPDQLRWENVEPIPSVLIFSGDKGMRCNENAPPVHFELAGDPVMNMIAEQVWTWVDGRYGRLRDKYALSLTESHQLQLIPQRGEFAGIIDAVQVNFDPQSLQPEQILIQEAGGDTTTIRFTGYRLNEPVPDHLFETCYPKQ